MQDRRITETRTHVRIPSSNWLRLAPVIAIGFLPENIADRGQGLRRCLRGWRSQQTVELEDMIRLGPWAGLGVVGATRLPRSSSRWC